MNMQRIAIDNGSLARNVQRFVVLSEFAKSKFAEGGLPLDKMVVKPNFLSVAYAEPEYGETERRGALFVGRLSPEKGLDTLIEAWQHLGHIPLRIAGDGPMQEQLLKQLPPGATYLGQLSPSDIRKEMASAKVLVVPSTCYEGFPMTIVEAYSQDLPVVASRIGSLAEIVVDGYTGRLFSPNSSVELREAVLAVCSAAGDFKIKIGQCRKHFDINFSESVNVLQTLAIYKEAISSVN